MEDKVINVDQLQDFESTEQEDVFLGLDLSAIRFFFHCFLVTFMCGYFIMITVIDERDYIRLLLDRLPKILESPLSKLAGTLSIITIGYGLYVFKDKQQFWYGVLETNFALLSCYATFGLIEEHLLGKSVELASLVTVVATLFLVVRGIGNIDAGFGKSFIFKKKVMPFCSLMKDSLPTLSVYTIVGSMYWLLYNSDLGFNGFYYYYFLINLVHGIYILTDAFYAIYVYKGRQDYPVPDAS